MTINITSRASAEAVIREQVISTIFQDAPKQSTFTSMACKLSNMTSNQTRMRALDFLPTTCWVDGDIGMRQTTKRAWDNVFIEVAELIVIVPISGTVLDDAEFDIFGGIISRVNETIGRCVDDAIISDVSRLRGWQNDIIMLTRQAGNNVTAGSSPDYYNLFLGEDGVISKIKEDGCMVTGTLVVVSMRAKLRGIRVADNSLTFKSDMQGSASYVLDGVSMYFSQNGVCDNTITQLVVDGLRQAAYSIRQDVTVKILDQGAIRDPTMKEIVYNLAQQGMVALRIVFRMGWALPSPATGMGEDRIGYPFVYLEPAIAVTTQKVIFTAQGDAETPVAISGATVDVSGSGVKTGTPGATESGLRAGTHPVKIKKLGYGQVTETMTVAGTVVAKDVALIKQ